MAVSLRTRVYIFKTRQTSIHFLKRLKCFVGTYWTAEKKEKSMNIERHYLAWQILKIKSTLKLVLLTFYRFGLAAWPYNSFKCTLQKLHHREWIASDMPYDKYTHIALHSRACECALTQEIILQQPEPFGKRPKKNHTM